MPPPTFPRKYRASRTPTLPKAGKNPWKSGTTSFAHSEGAAFFTGFTMRRKGPRRGENPASAGYAVKKVMNNYSQKIVCISSAHAEDTRILRNFCRERTDLFPHRCITVNNSVNCVEIFPSERTNHRLNSCRSRRRRARLVHNSCACTACTPCIRRAVSPCRAQQNSLCCPSGGSAAFIQNVCAAAG